MEENNKLRGEINDLLNDLEEEYSQELLQLLLYAIDEGYREHKGYKSALRIVKQCYNFSNVSHLRLRMIKEALELYNH